jgi:hypothetical protein
MPGEGNCLGAGGGGKMRSLLVAVILVVAVFIYLAVASRLDAPAAVPRARPDSGP